MVVIQSALINLIHAATGGLDRVVRYWNPYVPGKHIAVSLLLELSLIHI